MSSHWTRHITCAMSDNREYQHEQPTLRTGAFSSQMRDLFSGFLKSNDHTFRSRPPEYAVVNVSLA